MAQSATTNQAPALPERICPHCRRQIVIEAISPRWAGYCDHCAQHLANHPHIESA